MDLLLLLLELINETLAATIVVLAASILLYNVSRNLRNRVARTSAILLGCVTITYLIDVFVSLGPDLSTYDTALRLQWLGISFMPAALFHLADALLATTGLPSRGRRTRTVHILYLISGLFLATALFSNALIDPLAVRASVPAGQPMVSLRPGILFPLFTLYFIIAFIASFLFVNRARLRCVTRSTRRRMGYLQFAMLTPALGIFPFSVLLGAGNEFTLIGLIFVNVANFIVVLMLLFLAYPLSFFGSSIPDRVVKSELMRFILLGPMTGLLALGTYIFTNATTRILGIQGENFTPFAIVAVILMWQWLVSLALPLLERRLVYNGDSEQLEKLQYLSQRLLTRTDLMQLIDAILGAACDYLRVNTAFVALFSEDSLDLIRAVGPTAGSSLPFGTRGAAVRAQLEAGADSQPAGLIAWDGYWLLPLYGTGSTSNGSSPLGVFGIQARGSEIDLTADEETMLTTFAQRAASALDDMHLQDEIFAALEGLLPQIALTRGSTEDIEYRPGRGRSLPAPVIPDREQFNEQVRAALKHYWGGPGLTNSRLLELCIVRSMAPENDNNNVKALRATLMRAMERLRPEGEQKLLTPEWTLYSILELRFLKGLKVRDVANRLALSEPDFYRKQRIAIDHVADELWAMEASCRQP